MSASAAALSGKEYDDRKLFLEELKTLARSEQEEIYRILYRANAEYSENSNGVFFDVCKLPADIFQQMQKFMEFCKKNRNDFAMREEEERKAQEAIGHGV
jgi:hypothetical protein